MGGSQISLRQRPAFVALQAHYKTIATRHLRDLFREDPSRGQRMAVEALGLYFDYSKHRVSDETLGLLFDLAQACGLHDRIQAMFSGEKINLTENRAVLHVALARRATRSSWLMGKTSLPKFTPCWIE